MRMLSFIGTKKKKLLLYRFWPQGADNYADDFLSMSSGLVECPHEQELFCSDL